MPSLRVMQDGADEAVMRYREESMNDIRNFLIGALCGFQFQGFGLAHAAEFQVVDKLTVDGHSTFQSSIAVSGYSTFQSSVGFKTTDGIVMPNGSTAQRPAVPETGTMRYNITLGGPEYFNGTDWIAIVGISTSPVAGGGDEIKEVGGYRIHTFNFSGTFTVYKNITADVLVVAGGGGGGAHTTTNANGGGGAGGVVYAQNQALTPGNYTVTVGDGGTGYSWNTNARGVNGQNSVFGSLPAAIGGGGGAGQGDCAGNNGGSGGGCCNGGSAGNSTQAGGGGNITVYGNMGGNVGQGWTGGGGGGATSVGVNGNVCSNCPPSGNGGNGITLSISGSTVCYAGGGGGGGNSSERGGVGMCGGGRGWGSNEYYDYRIYPKTVNPVTQGSNSLDALPHTGGGGGGGSYWSNNAGVYLGGSGGSGIVIVRYKMP